jgi:hypothetical protein
LDNLRAKFVSNIRKMLSNVQRVILQWRIARDYLGNLEKTNIHVAKVSIQLTEKIYFLYIYRIANNILFYIIEPTYVNCMLFRCFK